MGSFRVYATTGLFIASLSTLAHAAKLEDVAPFPKAEAGFTRQVIHLPKQEQEDNFQVEILAGKTLEVDCNRQRLGGVLDEKNLEGWGYPFYRLESHRADEHDDGLPTRQPEETRLCAGRR